MSNRAFIFLGSIFVGLALVIFKLAGAISISWFWVTLPFFWPLYTLIAFFVAVIVILTFAVILGLVD